MKNIFFAAAFVAVSASQATALSCLAPDVATAFNDASESDRGYVILKGSFDFTPLPETDETSPQTVDSNFKGRLLTSAGFTQTVAAPVEIDMVCAGEWCASFEPNTEYIAFVENIDNEKLIFEVSPCYAFAFKDPDIETVKRLENCAQGGACEPLAN